LGVLFVGFARISYWLFIVYVVSLNTQRNSRTVDELGLSAEQMVAADSGGEL
jgi:hypothetical protein